jgi:hypothetical protein
MAHTELLFFEKAAAHCGEADGSVQYVSPDDDENE